MFTFSEWNSQFESEWLFSPDCTGPYPNREARKKLYKQYKLECERDMPISKLDFDRACSALKTANVPGPYQVICEPVSDINHYHGFTVCNGSSINLADIPCTVTAQPATSKSYWYNQPANKEKEENLMSLTYATKIAPTAYAAVNAAPSDTQTKIEYLKSRARDVKSDLDEALTKQFRLYQNAGPRTADELIDAIKAGEFTFDEEKKAQADKYFKKYGGDGYGILYAMKFNNFPGPDREGYDTAKKALLAEYQKIKDIINIKDADTALEAIQAFEGWSYEAPTVH